MRFIPTVHTLRGRGKGCKYWTKLTFFIRSKDPMQMQIFRSKHPMQMQIFPKIVWTLFSLRHSITIRSELSFLWHITLSEIHCSAGQSHQTVDRWKERQFYLATIQWLGIIERKKLIIITIPIMGLFTCNCAKSLDRARWTLCFPHLLSIGWLCYWT